METRTKKNSKNYWILLIVIVIAVGYFLISTRTKDPSLTFKEGVYFELNETVDRDALINNAIDETTSNFERIVQFDTPDTTTITTDSKRTIEVVVANKKGAAKEYQLEYEVKDSKASSNQ